MIVSAHVHDLAARYANQGNNELAFSRHFMTPAQRHARNVDDIFTVLAALMAQGCNIGLYTMG